MRRARLYNMTRNKLETKQKNSLIQFPVLTAAVSQTSLDSGQYLSLTNAPGQELWPSQGVTDITRLGDHINFKKIWLKITLENDASPTSNLLRVIVFSCPEAIPLTGLVGFWKFARAQPVINAQPDKELFNIYYDRTFPVNTLVALQRKCNMPININIRPKRWLKYGIQFKPGGSIEPKSINNQLFIAVVGYEPGVTANGTCGYVNVNTNLYFTD
jgi:hypothetical protein